MVQNDTPGMVVCHSVNVTEPWFGLVMKTTDTGRAAELDRAVKAVIAAAPKKMTEAQCQRIADLLLAGGTAVDIGGAA